MLAGHYAELPRGRARLGGARRGRACGKIAGAVGTYAHLTPAIEADALGRLGLLPETVATQIVPRDRHAAWLAALALVAAGIERFAINVRHWQRNEVGEAEEAFQKGQKGSSAMPHKRNPVLSENLCGLARVVRAAVVPGLEDVALWHERDISHSSVERMVMPDASATLAFMLERCRGLVEGLVVYPEAMRRNLDRTGSLWASEGVLLALVGKPGSGARRPTCSCSATPCAPSTARARFRDLLAADPDIAAHLSARRPRALLRPRPPRSRTSMPSSIGRSPEGSP